MADEHIDHDFWMWVQHCSQADCFKNIEFDPHTLSVTVSTVRLCARYPTPSGQQYVGIIIDYGEIKARAELAMLRAAMLHNAQFENPMDLRLCLEHESGRIIGYHEFCFRGITPEALLIHLQRLAWNSLSWQHNHWNKTHDIPNLNHFFSGSHSIN